MGWGAGDYCPTPHDWLFFDLCHSLWRELHVQFLCRQHKEPDILDILGSLPCHLSLSLSVWTSVFLSICASICLLASLSITLVVSMLGKWHSYVFSGTHLIVDWLQQYAWATSGVGVCDIFFMQLCWYTLELCSWTYTLGCMIGYSSFSVTIVVFER